MGNICTVNPHSAENRDDNRDINRNYARENKKERRIKKLLLLGAGSSGKSTLFKQLKCIYTEEGLARTVFIEARHCIRQNVMIAMLKLLTKTQDFAALGINKYSLDMNDKEILQCVKIIVHYADESFDEPLTIPWPDMQYLGQCLSFLWNLPAIKDDAFLKRNMFAMPDNIEYFYAKVNALFTESYEPSMEDVLKCRVKTAGMIEVKYKIENHIFHIYDVGGQRSERKKWIFCFESVCAVLFVAALNAYYSVIFEDEGVNAMHESIELFDELINSKWFRKADIIMFFNKNDLFVNLIRNGVSLNHCFTKAKKWKGVQWNGMNFNEQRIMEELRNPISNIENIANAVSADSKYESVDENESKIAGAVIGHKEERLSQSMNKVTLLKSKEIGSENSMDFKRDFSSVDVNLLEDSNSNEQKSREENGTMYMPTFNGNQQLQLKFLEYYKNALDFITERYLERDIEKNSRIYIHVTTATDVMVIQKVFMDVQNIVIRDNLHRTGLY